MKRLLLLFGFICAVLTVSAQKGAVIDSDELTYNFGIISEEEGLASHVFVIKNTGGAPLVINRVTASCGCTRPEWSKEPVAPGKTTNLKVSYDPTGRPGPFTKMVSIYSNGKKGSFNLAIKGTVTARPFRADFSYPYAIGELKLHTKTVLFSSVIPTETAGERIMVVNSGKEDLEVRMDKLPSYLIAEINPKVLSAGETGEITLLLDGHSVKKPGRYTTSLNLVVGKGKTEAKGSVLVSANVVDDFSKLSATAKANAPQIQLSSTLVDFGTLPNKGKVSRELKVTNVGKSKLLIHSISCENELVSLQGNKREIKPGATVSYTILLHPKEIKTKLEALVNIVCNDPNGPVRLIKVTASN